MGFICVKLHKKLGVLVARNGTKFFFSKPVGIINYNQLRPLAHGLVHGLMHGLMQHSPIQCLVLRKQILKAWEGRYRGIERIRGELNAGVRVKIRHMEHQGEEKVVNPKARHS
jgi:hypothetical protein